MFLLAVNFSSRPRAAVGNLGNVDQVLNSFGGMMATGMETWEAAKGAVRDEIRKIRPNQTVWTNITPDQIGVSADSWIVLSADMIDNFNLRNVKSAVAIPKQKRRTYRTKPFLDFVKALRDA